MSQAPPNHLEAEQSVLAAVMFDNQALNLVMDILEPEDFYQKSHEVMFMSMREMFEKNVPVDLVTLADHLTSTGRLNEAGGPSALSELSGRVSTSANVEYWAKIVRDKSLLRRLINQARDLVARAMEEPEHVEEFMDLAEHKILEVASEKARTSYRPIGSIVSDAFGVISDYKDRKGAVTGVPTGYDDLDKMTSGFQKGDLIIMAGRPSTGKTALALNILRNATLEADKIGCFFSLEMSALSLVMRMICSEARVPFDRLRRGEFKQPQFIAMTNAADSLSRASIFIEDSASLSVVELKAKARRLKAESGLDFIMVDYLQLLRGSDSKRSRDSREQEIAEISRSLKGMAKELDVPVLALSQLSRALEKREDKTPILSDLRESGSIEQDADLILFLHRPGMYQKKKDRTGYNAYAEDENSIPSDEDDRLTELIIGKQRNGPTGIIKLTFLKEYTRFEPFAGHYDPTMSPA